MYGANKVAPAPGRLVLLIVRVLPATVVISLLVIVFAVVATVVRVFGAAQTIPAPSSWTSAGVGTATLTIADKGAGPFSTFTTRRIAVASEGTICASCAMPTPAELGDPLWMETHLLYQAAAPALVAEAGVECPAGATPRIKSVRTLVSRIGTWSGRVRIGCAKP